MEPRLESLGTDVTALTLRCRYSDLAAHDDNGPASALQELNRRLRAAVQAFFSHLREAAEPWLSGGGGGEAQMCVWRRDGVVTLKLKSELAGLPFHWEFRCSPAPVALVCAQLVRPLLAMSRLLHRQLEEQGELLARKDQEIQDYRENGATLSRERLQTDVFNKQLYTEDFIQKVRAQRHRLLLLH
uniref:Nonhomologous end-joining factor 1 n=1 Tax=Xiphophorus couchianus TaxID=32473 RepID=A0A3B5LY17_9TELE